jgi:hypothetical protein
MALLQKNYEPLFPSGAKKCRNGNQTIAGNLRDVIACPRLRQPSPDGSKAAVVAGQFSALSA